MRKILLITLMFLNFQVNGQCWKTIATGTNHTVAIRTDGALWAWGDNSRGQLGDNTNTTRDVPKKIGTTNDWKTVSLGGVFTVALKTDGTLWTWGGNSYGELGDGTTVAKKIPTRIGLANDWQIITAGDNHIVALKTDGTLWAWGNNNKGQLGDGTNINKSIPTQIGTDNDWQTIEAGYRYTVAIKKDGTLWTWGGNTSGELGNNTVNTESNVPIKIGTATNWKTIAAGYHHTVAIKTDGTLWAWGEAAYGNLGSGTAADTSVPTQIGKLTDWKTVAVGGDHTVATKTDGSLWAWGYNLYGQLGNGTTVNSFVPVKIGSANNWVAIATGSSHSVGLGTDGTLWTWGSNSIGQLGDGTVSNKNVPIIINCPGAFTVTTDITNLSCVGDTNGSASIVSVSGGIESYSYLWSNGGITSTITGLTAGDYSCTITDATSLSVIKNVTITQPTPVTFSTTSTDTACNENYKGSITVMATGGTAPYQYAISSNLEYQTSNVFTGLSSGTYIINVKDAKGCIGTDSKGTVVNTINVIPPTATAQTFPMGVTVASLQVSGLNVKWYSGITGGDVLDLSTALQTGKYYVSQTIDGCESTRTAVDVTIIQAPKGYTLIPDVKFEQKLIALGIDSGTADGKVLTANISSVTTLNVSDNSITDLTGIQNFLALKDLDCHNNQLTSLNISNNTALTDLDCSSNQLTTLDVSKNTALKELSFNYNKVTSLDVSKNIILKSLNFTSNQLTNLDVSNNTVLDLIYCSSNKLTTLDVSKNTLLTYLYFSHNQITALDVSKNTLLTNLTCNNTLLKSLDVSKNTALSVLHCDSNQLTSLNLKNGYSTKLSSINFKNNPNLSCIQVDYLPYFNVYKANAKDATASYSEDCLSSSLSVTISTEFEDKLIALGIDTDGKNGQVLISSVDKITTLDVSSSSISDLTGIQYFYALTSLSCDNNQLTNLDVTFNPSLTNLSCVGNSLTSLNVLNNKYLTDLNCSANQLANLDFSQNTVLKTLSCSANHLASLNVSKNIALTDLNCNNNEIKNIDVSKNTALKNLYCNDNKLLKVLNLKNGNNTKLVNGDFKNNPSLSCVQVDEVAYSDANWSNFKDVTMNYSNDCPDYYTLIPDVNFEKKLIALGIDSGTADGRVLTSKIEKLTSLNVSSSSITDLTGIQSFSSLKTLSCSSNQLTDLDVSKNILLTDLSCSNNKLINLDVSKNTSLEILNCMSNSLKSLDISKNTVLAGILCSSNQLTSLNLKNGQNLNFDPFNTDFTNNPNLSCIQVNDVAYSNANLGSSKDATASYSENCSSPYVVISSEFEDKLIALGIDTDGKNGSVLLVDVADVKSIDVSNSGIINLSGIENFTALETLICKANSLSAIDVTHNVNLKYLDCSENPLTALDVTKNTQLTELYCDGITTINNKRSNAKTSIINQLTVLDLSNNLLLTKLDCSNNQIVSLDVSKNTLLTDINCSNNSLQTLNLSNGNNAKLVNVNFKTNASLSCIQVDDNVYANANWSVAKDVIATYSKTACTLGIEDVVYNTIAVYPNPVKDDLHIDNVIVEKATVYDALGKLVKTKTFANGSNSNSINLAGLPNGIYYIYLESQGATIVKKIIVE